MTWYEPAMLINRDNMISVLKIIGISQVSIKVYIFKLLRQDALCVFGAEKEMKDSSKGNYSLTKVTYIQL